MGEKIRTKIEMESYRRQLADEYLAGVFMRCVIPKPLRETLNANRLSLMSEKLNVLICQDQANEGSPPGQFWDAFLQDTQWQQRWPRRSIPARTAIIRSSFPMVSSDALSSDTSLLWLHRMMASSVDTYYAMGSQEYVVLAKDVQGLSDTMVIRSEERVVREDQKKHANWHADQRILSNRAFCYGLLHAWRKLDQPVQRRLIARDVLIHDLRATWSELIQQWTAGSIDTSPFIYRCGNEVRAFQDYVHRRVEFDDETLNGTYLNDYSRDIGYYAVPDVYKNGHALVRWLYKRTSNVWNYLANLNLDQVNRVNFDAVMLSANAWWPIGTKRSVTAWIVEGMRQLNLDQAYVEISSVCTLLVTHSGYRYDRVAPKGDKKEGEENPAIAS